MTILELSPYFIIAGMALALWLINRKADNAIREVEIEKNKTLQERRRANVANALLEQAELSRKEMNDAINKDVEEARHTRRHFSK